MPSAHFIQTLNTRTIDREGTSVTLPNGTTLKAIIHHFDHELLRSAQNDGDTPEKQAVVLVFSGSAWGKIGEGARVSIGTGGMLRTFLVGDPLHPSWLQDIVTELAVVAYPS